MRWTPLALVLPLLPIGAALRTGRAAAQVLQLVHAGSGQSSGNGSLPSLFCFSVVRPGPEAELLRLHLEVPMLAGCDAYAVYSNVSMMELMGVQGAMVLQQIGHGSSFVQAVNGSMDVGMEGYPAENPKTFSASNTPIFKQAWRALFATGARKRYDWVVKVDPDTILFPDRLRTILRGYHPEEMAVLFDGGDLCKTGMGGIVVLSRTVVDVFEKFADFFLNVPVQREDGLLSAITDKMLHAKVIKEPNLVLNPVLHGCHASWKAAYHPFKAVWFAKQCLQTAPKAAPPPPAELHTRCT
mmetsp:Transcript_115650/g.338265  ORF Transcript_115650/g.338265 Transcript_115650/m.338265 type:complete len:298 (-) Transcript_115650:40-933(-)